MGLDPSGKCPNNPEDEIQRNGDTDYTDVVEQRIEKMERRAYQAERDLQKVAPSKIALANELQRTKEQLQVKTHQLNEIERLLRPSHDQSG